MRQGRLPEAHCHGQVQVTPDESRAEEDRSKRSLARLKTFKWRRLRSSSTSVSTDLSVALDQLADRYGWDVLRDHIRCGRPADRLTLGRRVAGGRSPLAPLGAELGFNYSCQLFWDARL